MKKQLYYLFKIFMFLALLCLITVCMIGCGNSNFSIDGKWKNVGENTFGQAQKGSIVVFNGTNCNWYSPQDTYAFYKDGDNYRLDITGALFGENRSFKVVVTDKNNIEIYNGSTPISMKRVE